MNPPRRLLPRTLPSLSPSLDIRPRRRCRCRCVSSFSLSLSRARSRSRSRSRSAQAPLPFSSSKLIISSRHSSTSSSSSGPKSHYAPLPTRHLVSLTGPDSTRFLQGAITANISSASPSGFYAGFLNAQGRVLHDVFIYPDRAGLGRGHGRGVGMSDGQSASGTDSWLIEVDAAEAVSLASHIKRYKLRAKFDVRVLEEGECTVWSVWRDGASASTSVGMEAGSRDGPGWTKHTLGGTRASETADVTSDGEIVCSDDRAPGMGRRLLLAGHRAVEQSRVLQEAVDAVEATELRYRERRYRKGVPEGQAEIVKGVALPQESNLDFMGAIDYRKGCYVGQELTIRTHHTGVVRKRILPLVVYSADEEEVPSGWPGVPLADGEGRKDLHAENIPRDAGISRWERKGRSAGKWLAGVGNVGLGLCRLEIMTDGVAKGRVEGEGAGWRAGDEFKVQWGEDDDGEGKPRNTVKVKAVVPSWHLTNQI